MNKDVKGYEKQIYVNGVEYSLRDFTNDKGFEIFGWYAPPIMKGKDNYKFNSKERLKAYLQNTLVTKCIRCEKILGDNEEGYNMNRIPCIKCNKLKII